MDLAMFFWFLINMIFFPWTLPLAVLAGLLG